jgi:hypothetical protein
MPDNVGYTPGSGATIAADEIGGVLHQRVKIGVGADGVAADVSAANPLPISGVVNTGLSQPLTDAQIRATPLPVSASTLPLPTGAATESTLSALNTKTPAVDNNRSPVIPSMFNGGNISVQTAATGTNYTAFASQVCKQLTLSNQSGVTIEVRQGAAGVALQIPTGAFYTFFGITNANQLDVRRVDTQNTQVTITARWEA